MRRLLPWSGNRVRLCGLLICASIALYGQGIITTIAGKDFAFTGDGQPGSNVALGAIPGATSDSQGNIYFSDVENDLVLKEGPDGVLHVIAGNGIPGYSGDGGPATKASLDAPLAVAVDAAGNVYVSEGFSHRIRKISAAGIISTFAGSGQPATSGDGGPATAAGIGQEVYGMVFDSAGNMFFSQRDEHVIRKIDGQGVITTVAGTGQPGYSGDGGPAAKAQLAGPFGLAFDVLGNLLLSDGGNFRIRSISSDGIISTVAGGGFFPNDGVPASTAAILPLGLAADASGNIYVGDYLTARVRRVDSNGIISTIAGSGLRGFSGDGGPALTASLAAPFALTLDGSGNVYFADFATSNVRKIGTDTTIITVAGNGKYAPSPDGAVGTATSLRYPGAIATVPDGSLLVSEFVGARVRRIGPDGIVSTVAGIGQAGITPDGGRAASATISLPNGVGQDAAGNVYFAEEINFKVRKVSPAGTITTVAGTGLPSAIPTTGVPANSSPLGFPYGLALDAAGNVYFTDEGQNLVRRVSTSGIISTVAGSGAAGFSGDNGPALSAKLNGPNGVAVDAAGNVFFSDLGNLRVRRVSTAGVISTVAGTGSPAYSGEGGPAVKASLSPGGLAIDATGNLFVADPNNHKILKITAAGIISTVAGNGRPGSAGDGGPATAASLNSPEDVAVDSKGNIYIADTGNGRVRVVLAAPATYSLSTNTLSFTGKSTGALADAQNVQISGSISGLPFTASVSTTSAGGWLQTNLQKGTMPYSLQISADPGQLRPGTYQGTVTITASAAQPAVQTINISFTIASADPPALSAITTPLTFALIQGQNAATNPLAVTNTGGGSIAVTGSAVTAVGGNWLSINPTEAAVSAGAPGNFTITADPTGLAPGTYPGQVTIGGSTGQTAVVPVTLIVSPSKQQLLLTSSGFTFTAVAGGGVVPPQSFGVANGGDGALSWTASPGPNWLTLFGSSGTSTAGGPVPQVQVNVNAGTLPPGTYYDRVTIAAPLADNAPQIVSAVLNVLTPDASPGPVVQPAGLVFTAVAGGGSPGSQTVTLYNIGTTPQTFNSNRLTLDGNNWFVHLPAAGTVTPQSPQAIVVQPNLTGLGPGVYSGVITLIFPNQVVRTVNLLFVVAPAVAVPPVNSAATRTQSLAPANSAGCVPQKLAPLFTSFSSGFTGPVGWPVAVALQIVDDCGMPLTTGSVAVTFSNGDAPLVLNPLGGGLWSGTWTPRQAQSNNVTVTAKAQSTTGLTGQTQVSGQAQANAGVPLLRPGSIVNTAYPGAPVPLAPGSLVSLFGSGLATSQQTATGLPLPVQLGGSAVIMAGRELPLIFTSDGQVNTLIPYDMGFNTSQQLVVQSGSKLTSPESVPIAAAQPVIFTTNNSGGQGLIYLTAGGGQTLADGQNPATAGNEILIQASGLGAVTPVIDSTTAPGPQAPQTVNPVSLTIGGVVAQVELASLSAGGPGVYNVLAIVPAGVTAGGAVPVVLSAGGSSSPAATMAIQ